MIYLKGQLARPLDTILGTASRLAAARALFKAPEGLTGRQVAVHAGINHQAAAQALKALDAAGIVSKREHARSTQWTLDRRRFVVGEALIPLFKAEKRHAEEIVGAIKSRLARKADVVVIVGEAAKGRLTPGTALELVALCEAGRRRPLSEALRILAQDFEERFGLTLSVSVLTKREAAAHRDLSDGWQLLPTEGRPSISTPAR